jgi:CTP:molybdopterin cytidylyltransferase MocA
VIARHSAGVERVAVDDEGVVNDIDTRQDYEVLGR